MLRKYSKTLSPTLTALYDGLRDNKDIYGFWVPGSVCWYLQKKQTPSNEHKIPGRTRIHLCWLIAVLLWIKASKSNWSRLNIKTPEPELQWLEVGLLINLPHKVYFTNSCVLELDWLCIYIYIYVYEWLAWSVNDQNRFSCIQFGLYTE